VVAIEYPNLGVLGDIAALVAPGGHLILETIPDRGKNWVHLPVLGSIGSYLEGEFSVLGD
jgi:2-polyprenyl-3-methyl-5-hydroxy-6-metoxy-1,4-benzoquinol methylase